MVELRSTQTVFYLSPSDGDAVFLVQLVQVGVRLRQADGSDVLREHKIPRYTQHRKVVFQLESI
jgi:hypothetical protein